MHGWPRSPARQRALKKPRMHPAGPVQTFLLPLFPPSLPPPEYGSYSAGYHQAPCTSCGEGFNTTDQALPSKVAKQGASASENCAVDFGWSYVNAADTSKGLKPCIRGYYKEFGIAPMVRKVCKESGFKLNEIYELFPSGPAKGACKLAGLPKPTGCV